MLICTLVSGGMDSCMYYVNMYIVHWYLMVWTVVCVNMYIGIWW